MTLNPLDWTAGPFLAFYCAVACIALILARSNAARIRSAQREVTRTGGLCPAEVALLRGGYKRATDTVIVEHLIDSRVTMSEGGHLTAPASAELSRLASAAFGRDRGIPIDRQAFATRLKPYLVRLRGTLAAEGLALSEAENHKIFRSTLLLFVPVLCVGVAKVLVGIQRDRPVGILLVLIAATISAIWVLGRDDRLATPEGLRLLERTGVPASRMARAPLPHEVAMAFAIVGPSALAGTAASAYASQSASNGGGCGAGGCGGGGGCGGCGGGGD